MKDNTKDRFSVISDQYARFRPIYPQDLYEAILEHVPVKDLALDCGTGNGQAAESLAHYFSTVYATDISKEQLSKAPQIKNVHYEVLPGHKAPNEIADNSVDLITSAQAAHWFDEHAFAEMAHNKLKPDGVIAIWGYGVHESADKVLTAAIHNFAFDVLGSYWDPEPKKIWAGYKDFYWPFEDIKIPDLFLTTSWNLSQTIGYFKSWSAGKKFIDAQGEEAFIRNTQAIVDAWGNPSEIKELFVKLVNKVGRKIRT